MTKLTQYEDFDILELVNNIVSAYNLNLKSEKLYLRLFKEDGANLT